MRSPLAVALVALVAVLVGPGCGGKSGGSSAPEAPPPSPFEGAGWRDLLPAGATFLVGVDASRLLSSPVVRDLLPLLHADAPRLRQTFESAASECGLSLPGDVGEVVLASYGAKNPNAVAIASGQFDDETVSRCMELLLSLRGSAPERVEVAGRSALKSSRPTDNAWVARASDRLLVLAGSRGWLARTLTPKTPRFSAEPSDVRALLAEFPVGRALWAAGSVPADSEPARLAAGVAGEPVGAFYGYVDLEGGLRAELGAVMKSAQGAGKLIEFLKAYLESSQALLEERGLADYAARLELSARGRIARVGLALDRAEVDRLVARLRTHEASR